MTPGLLQQTRRKNPLVYTRLIKHCGIVVLVSTVIES